MGSARSPERDRAFKIWMESGGEIKMKDIAAQLGVADSKIRKWKTLDKWNEKAVERSTGANGALHDEKEGAPAKKRGPGAPKGNKNARGHGAPKGNKNALGNKGGAPKRNKNAVKTGEYRTVWVDYLDEDERSFYNSVDTSADSQIDHAIRILAMKERWCMQAIKDLRAGLTEKEKKILAERKEKGEIVRVYDETGSSSLQYRGQPELMITEITETEFRKIDDIIKQEQILLKIQNAKAKQIALKHRIDIDYERLELEREKARLTMANLLRLSKSESEIPGIDEGNKVMVYIPDNGRDTDG